MPASLCEHAWKHLFCTRAPLHPQAQDDWVPLDTIRELAQALFRSSCKLLQDICPVGELRTLP